MDNPADRLSRETPETNQSVDQLFHDEVRVFSDIIPVLRSLSTHNQACEEELVVARRETCHDE